MPAHTWWSSYGSETPQLQSLAIKVLSQVTVEHWPAKEIGAHLSLYIAKNVIG
jgi:hypothetical protein